MAIFFVPAAVGLMVYADLFSNSILAITFAIAISTVLTIVTVALVQERFEKHRKKGKKYMNNLLEQIRPLISSEVFLLMFVMGTYLLGVYLYKLTKISLMQTLVNSHVDYHSFLKSLE